MCDVRICDLYDISGGDRDTEVIEIRVNTISGVNIGSVRNDVY